MADRVRRPGLSPRAEWERKRDILEAKLSTVVPSPAAEMLWRAEVTRLVAGGTDTVVALQSVVDRAMAGQYPPGEGPGLVERRADALALPAVRREVQLEAHERVRAATEVLCALAMGLRVKDKDGRVWCITAGGGLAVVGVRQRIGEAPEEVLLGGGAMDFATLIEWVEALPEDERRILLANYALNVATGKLRPREVPRG